MKIIDNSKAKKIAFQWYMYHQQKSSLLRIEPEYDAIEIGSEKIVPIKPTAWDIKTVPAKYASISTAIKVGYLDPDSPKIVLYDKIYLQHFKAVIAEYEEYSGVEVTVEIVDHPKKEE